MRRLTGHLEALVPPSSDPRRPRFFAISSLSIALLLDLTLPTACSRETPPPPEVEHIEVEPSPTTIHEVEPLTITEAPRRDWVVHDVAQLEREDLSDLEHLDLALSPADLVGIIANPDPAAVCQDLDLRRVARATPHLRSLRISGCAAAIHAGLGAFTQLEALQLADLDLDEPTVTQISKLEQLQELTFSRVAVRTDRLKPLSALRLARLSLVDLERDSELTHVLELWPKTLHALTLAGPWAGHKAMLRVPGASALEAIELRETRVGNFSLNQIKGLPNLRQVTLAGSTFNDNSPLYFRELPVTNFTCDCSRLGDAGLRSLRHSRGLQTLALLQSHITGEGLQALSELHDLESVTVHGPDISGPGLLTLATHRKLRHLDLAGQLEDPKLTGLGELAGLEVLRLGYENLDDRVAPQLAKLTRLERLDLSHTRVSDPVMQAIASMTALRELKLHHTRITHRGLIHLAPLHNLEVLELDHTDLLDGGTEVLANLSQLRVLRLDHTLITDTTVSYLKGLRRLEQLNLSNTVVTAAGVAVLEPLPALEVLGLEDTRATTRP